MLTGGAEAPLAPLWFGSFALLGLVAAFVCTAVKGDDGRVLLARWGGFLPEVPFAALAYGIPPTSLASILPAQLLSLEMAARPLRARPPHTPT